MASRASSKSSSGSSSGFGSFVLGFLFALVALGVGGYCYLKFGKPPVAAADPAFPFEAQIVQVPLNARIAKELKQPPFGISEDGFEAGARIYKKECASCHGAPGQDTPYAKWMYPVAPQLWKKHTKNDVVGVSDDEPGETFWKIENGIRLTGMPAYKHILTDTQMWQVALLLKSADQPLPDPVRKLLEDAHPDPVRLAH
ncbi:c-type cytochrome [Granulicella rosea]|nr:cytochrome c [Granulicella rosea]